MSSHQSGVWSFFRHYPNNEYRFYVDAAQDFCLEYIYDKVKGRITADSLSKKIHDILRQNNWGVTFSDPDPVVNIATLSEGVLEQFRQQTNLWLSRESTEMLRLKVLTWFRRVHDHYELINRTEVIIRPFNIKRYRN